MKMLGDLRDEICLIVFDIDNTLYENHDYAKQGCLGEMRGIADTLKISMSEVMELLEITRKTLSLREKRDIALTEIVYNLGITPKQWSELRQVAWVPEKWISYDSEICETVFQLSQYYKIAFATNSPVRIGEKILDAIGITGGLNSTRVFGPENLGYSKPDKRFFEVVSAQMDTPRTQCLSVGDREFFDGTPALSAGYCGAVIINDKNELFGISARLISLKQIRNKDGGQ